jgi:hypothetical protein
MNSDKTTCGFCARTDPHTHEVTERPKRERAKEQLQRLADMLAPVFNEDAPIPVALVADTVIGYVRTLKGNEAALKAAIARLQADVAGLAARNGKRHELYRQSLRQINALKDECQRIAGENGRLRANVAILNVDKIDPVAAGLAFFTVPAYRDGLRTREPDTDPKP